MIIILSNHVNVIIHSSVGWSSGRGSCSWGSGSIVAVAAAKVIIHFSIELLLRLLGATITPRPLTASLVALASTTTTTTAAAATLPPGTRPATVATITRGIWAARARTARDISVNTPACCVLFR